MLDGTFVWKGKAYFKQHLDPIFNETMGEDGISIYVNQITTFVKDLENDGYRMICLTPTEHLAEPSKVTRRIVEA